MRFSSVLYFCVYIHVCLPCQGKKSPNWVLNSMVSMQNITRVNICVWQSSNSTTANLQLLHSFSDSKELLSFPEQITKKNDITFQKSQSVCRSRFHVLPEEYGYLSLPLFPFLGEFRVPSLTISLFMEEGQSK